MSNNFEKYYTFYGENVKLRCLSKCLMSDDFCSTQIFVVLFGKFQGYCWNEHISIQNSTSWNFAFDSLKLYLTFLLNNNISIETRSNWHHHISVVPTTNQKTENALNSAKDVPKVEKLRCFRRPHCIYQILSLEEWK